MFEPIKLVEIELGAPLRELAGSENHESARALIRLHGAPLGWVQVALPRGGCPPEALADAILARHGEAIVRHGLHDALAGSPPERLWRVEDLLEQAHPAPPTELPPVTVAICTRDRPSELARCLEAASRLAYPKLELLVVDNAPTSDATERLVRTSHPAARYLQEPRPGLDWARNRAIREARGEVIAFTDDDVSVDPGWVRALAEVFAESPDVMAVTGLVVPDELETRAQYLFEQYDGFGRGFTRKWVRVDHEGGERAAARHGNVGKYGGGANMAFRRSLFARIGGFDPALDVGTVTNGGGDLDLLFRVLQAGHLLVYDPRALVRHRHRREDAGLVAQLEGWGTGMYAYVARSVRAHPEQRLLFLRLALWNLGYRFTRRLLTSSVHRRYPPGLNLHELRGALKGSSRYARARATAAEIAARFGPELPVPPDEASPQETPVPRSRRSTRRSIDLSRPLEPLTDVGDFASVRLSLTWKGEPLGSARIRNLYRPVGLLRLRDAIAARLPLGRLGVDRNDVRERIRRRMLARAASPG